MNNHEANAARLRKALDAIATTSSSNSELAKAMNELREALLLFGSHSDDNLRAAKKIDVWAHDDGHVSECALSVNPSGIPLSDIIYEVESLKLPRRVARRLPNLSQDEWSAALRIIVLVLKAFEQREENNDQTTDGG